MVQPDKPAWRVIIGTFGVDVLNDDRSINRERLGSIIFDNEEERRALNRITHPYIQSAIVWELIKYFLKGERKEVWLALT